MKPVFNPYAKKKPGQPSSSAAAVAAPPLQHRGGGGTASGGTAAAATAGAHRSTTAGRPLLSSGSTKEAAIAEQVRVPTEPLQKPTTLPSSEQVGLASRHPTALGGGVGRPPNLAALPPRGLLGAPASTGVASKTSMSASAGAHPPKPMSLKAKLKADIEKIKRENQHKKLLKQQQRQQQQQQQQQQQARQANSMVNKETTSKDPSVVVRRAGRPSPVLQHRNKENVGETAAAPAHASSSNASASTIGQGAVEEGQDLSTAISTGAGAAPPPPPVLVVGVGSPHQHAVPRADEQKRDSIGSPAEISPPAQSESSGAVTSYPVLGETSRSMSGAVTDASPTSSVSTLTIHSTKPDAVPFVTPSATAPHPNRGSGDEPSSPMNGATTVGTAPSTESPMMDSMQCATDHVAADAAGPVTTAPPPLMVTQASSEMTNDVTKTDSTVESSATSVGSRGGAATTTSPATESLPTTVSNVVVPSVDGSKREEVPPRQTLPPCAPSSAPTVTNPAQLMSPQLLATQQTWQQPLHGLRNPFYGYWNQRPLAQPSYPAMYPMQPMPFSPTGQAPVAWPSIQQYYPMMAAGGTYGNPWYGLPWNPWSMPTSLGGQVSAVYTPRKYAPAATRSKNSSSSSSSARLLRPESNMLAVKPLEAPSPYAYTHGVLGTNVVLTKTPSDPDRSSFGITLRLDVQSALVPLEWLIANKYLVVPSSTSSTETAVAPTTSTAEEAAQPASDGQHGESVNASNDTVPAAPAGEEAMKTVPSNPLIVNGGTEQATAASLTAKRIAPRRKRWHFAVLAVQDATKHNGRGPSGGGGSPPVALQAGDVILTIDGKPTEGLTFQQAVGLLRDFNRVDEDGVARCPVVIARRKPPVVSRKQAIAGTRITANPVVRKAPLTSTETVSFLGHILKVLTDPLRLLGKPISDDNLRSIADGSPNLTLLSVDFMRGVWKGMTNDVRTRIDSEAIAHWTSEWQKEPDASRVPGVQYITDAQRATLRALPRPAKGCRCGSTEHEYVTSVNCPLYSNLRGLAPPEFNESLGDEGTAISSKAAKDLNAVEKAFKDRYVKMKSEQKAQDREATFVSMMEDIQVTRRKQAIFAPSLQCMVLSTVAELQQEFAGLHLEPLQSATVQPVDQGGTSGSNVNELNPNPSLADSDDDDDDDDDDVPLALLGKRSTKGEDSSTKRSRQEVPVRLCFIARLLKDLSMKWGHVYREPTDEEYAWRWEVYHGQTSTAGSVWDANSRNPRKPGSLSLECVRFGIEDEFPTNLDVQSMPPPVHHESRLKVLASLAAPESTGVVDELLALIRMGVLHVDERGIPRLADDWWNQVDLLILEDMNNLWNPKADPHNKFGVVDEIRVPLKEKWRRTRDGWVMTAEPNEIVFDFDEFDVWREAFEEKQQEEQDDDEGIGKFGI